MYDEEEKFRQALAKQKRNEKHQILAEVRDLQKRFNAFLQENPIETNVSESFKYQYKPNAI